MPDNEDTPTTGINTYNEKSLHADLKRWYSSAGDQLEVKVDGFIIDLVRGDLLVEIQTGSFSPLKRKLARLVEDHPVRLVFPIPEEKWIITLSPGEIQPPRRRKSPKRGRVEQVFSQLIYIPQLIHNRNFSLEVLLTREEEVRRPVAKKHARSKGWSTEERRLLEVIDRRTFHSAADLADLLPNALEDPFTVRELAKIMRQPLRLAQKTVYSLRIMGILTTAGKKGRANLYSRHSLTMSSLLTPETILSG
jgi:hypothetical protein